MLRIAFARFNGRAVAGASLKRHLTSVQPFRPTLLSGRRLSAEQTPLARHFDACSVRRALRGAAWDLAAFVIPAGARPGACGEYVLAARVVIALSARVVRFEAILWTERQWCERCGEG